MRLNYREVWRCVNAIYPIYPENGGNATVVLMTGGEQFIDPRRTKTIAAALARVFALDIVALREDYGQVVNKRSEVPIPIHPRLTLVPVRTRKPEIKDDGGLGYVVWQRVDRCHKSPEPGFNSRVVFTDGSVLDTILALNTLEHRLFEAYTATKRIQELYENVDQAQPTAATASDARTAPVSQQHIQTAAESPRPYLVIRR